jgi:hypothetical protein
MDTKPTPADGLIPADVLADMAEAARYAASGVRDPEVMRQACERMDRMREEIRRQHGVLNIAVDLIREVRDES